MRKETSCSLQNNQSSDLYLSIPPFSEYHWFDSFIIRKGKSNISKDKYINNNEKTSSRIIMAMYSHLSIYYKKMWK